MKDSSIYYYRKMPDENFFVDIFKKVENSPGATFDLHWHEHLQFYYFTKGEAIIICNSKKIKVKSHDLVIINSNELHYAESLCDDLVYYVIKVDLSFIFSNQIDSCQTKFIAPLAQNLILFKNLVSNDKDVLNCIDKIIREYFDKEIGFELAIKSCIYELIVLLLRRYVKKVFTEKEFNTQINNLKRFKGILEYVENNFTKKININELAAMANISNYHFCRTFKQITGNSAVYYINKLRIDKAVSLLSETDLNITEISLACGFDDSNYFSRIFKKYRIISPAEFKKVHLTNS